MSITSLPTTEVYRGEHIIEQLLDVANSVSGSRMVEVEGVSLVFPVERKFASIESIQCYCDRIVARLSCSPVAVRSRKGNSKAHYCLGEIAIPDKLGSWAMREFVVLHELAHHLAPYAHHGPEWREAMISLVSEEMAPEVGLALRMVWSRMEEI